MRPRARLLRPVRPNQGLEMAYRRRLLALLDAMHADVAEAVARAWGENTPHMARDELGISPARALVALMRRLGAKWERQFAALAPELARYFARDALGRSDAALAAALRKAGFSVRFSMTRKVNDIVQAAIGENVALIKSIPAQFLGQVQGSVLRAVQAGADQGAIARDLREHFGVAKRRAAFIAHDQNAKATSVIVRARQQEAGITQAIWRHSGAGKHPRPEHVRASGKVYETAKGMYLEGVWTFPGKEINCRCVSIPIIPGLARAA